jgi:hypothetical protein
MLRGRTGGEEGQDPAAHAAQRDLAALGDLAAYGAGHLAGRQRALPSRPALLEVRLAVAVALQVAGVQGGVAADGESTRRVDDGRRVARSERCWLPPPVRLVRWARRSNPCTSRSSPGPQLPLDLDKERAPGRTALCSSWATRTACVSSPASRCWAIEPLPAAGERKEAGAVLGQVVPGGQRLAFAGHVDALR